MGSATILSGGTDGLYTIRIDLGDAERNRRIAAIDKRLAELESQINQREVWIANNQVFLDAAKSASNALIQQLATAMQDDPQGNHDALKKLVQGSVENVINLERQIAAVRIPLEMDKAERANLRRDRAYYAGLQLVKTQEAWCADLTEDASGDVETLEIPGEPRAVLVAPLSPDDPRTPLNGRLVAREVMTPEQVFLNAALLPGWQKFKPTFRLATITAIDVDADEADVTLDPATSSAQGLPINQVDSLVGVPVVYMTCNAAAFEVGDRVVVEFAGQAWSGARVIGFESNPKPCETFFLSYQATSGATVSGDNYQDGLRRGDDGTQVCGVPRPPTTFVHWVWWRWSDGNESACRTDTNVQESLTVQAEAIGFPRQVTLYLQHTVLDGASATGYGTATGNPENIGEYVADFPGVGYCPGDTPELDLLGVDVRRDRFSVSNVIIPLSGFTASVAEGQVLYETDVFEHPAGGGSVGQWSSDSKWINVSGLFVQGVTDVEITQDVPCGGSNALRATGTVERTTGEGYEVWDAVGPASITLTHTATGKTLTYTARVGLSATEATYFVE